MKKNTFKNIAGMTLIEILIGVLISSMLHYKYINYFKLKTKKIGNYEYLKKNYLSQNKNAKNIISEIKRFLNKNKINVRL